MPSPTSFLKQLSSTSKRWGTTTTNYNNTFGGCESSSLKRMEGIGNFYASTGGNDFVNGLVMRKRVMVVVDQTSHSKHAMMWALTHAVNKGDTLTLLHVVPPPTTNYNRGIGERADSCSPCLVNSLGSLCKASKPEVEIEGLVIQGPTLATVMSQAKKLEVAVLVLGKKKYSPLFNPIINCVCGSSSPREEIVEECINNLECMTIGVRKQSKGLGGYLISTKWQKDFWLLA